MEGPVKSVVAFMEAWFDWNQKWFRFAEDSLPHIRGAAWMAKFHVSGVWTAGFATKIGLVSEKYKTECPFCHQSGIAGGESQFHILMECQKYYKLHEKYIMPIWCAVNGKRVEMGFPVFTCDEIYNILLGGESQDGSFLWKAFSKKDGNSQVTSCLGEKITISNYNNKKEVGFQG